MSLKNLYRGLLRYLGNHLLFYFVNVLCHTLKITRSGYDPEKSEELEYSNYVLAFWHGKMIVPWYINRRTKISALISASGDGQLLTNILAKWGYLVSRGSSSQGGKIALETLVGKAKEGYNIAITPDGPRGPAKKMKAGAVISAQRAGVPLILVGVGYHNKYLLRSWDAMSIPKPFSRVNVVFSEPIWIESVLDRDEVSRIILECEQRLNDLNSHAENF